MHKIKLIILIGLLSLHLTQIQVRNVEAQDSYSMSPSNQITEGQKFYVNEVFIEGNKRVDTDAILIQLSKKEGEFTQQLISEEIKKLFETGYFDQVNASTRDIVRPGAMASKALVYTVVEKPVVRKVFIKGNAKVPEKDLTNIFNFGNKRFLDKAKLNALSKIGESYYQTRGYYDTKN